MSGRVHKPNLLENILRDHVSAGLLQNTNSWYIDLMPSLNRPARERGSENSRSGGWIAFSGPRTSTPFSFPKIFQPLWYPGTLGAVSGFIGVDIRIDAIVFQPSKRRDGQVRNFEGRNRTRIQELDDVPVVIFQISPGRGLTAFLPIGYGSRDPSPSGLHLVIFGMLRTRFDGEIEGI